MDIILNYNKRIINIINKLINNLNDNCTNSVVNKNLLTILTLYNEILYSIEGLGLDHNESDINIKNKTDLSRKSIRLLRKIRNSLVYFNSLYGYSYSNGKLELNLTEYQNKVTQDFLKLKANLKRGIKNDKK